MITFLAYLLLHIIKAAATAHPEHILLSCGSKSTLRSSDGRSWDGDVGTELSPDINAPNISFPATPARQDASINSTVPYLNARIIQSKLSYIFPLSPGQKILRLYFYPATYSTTTQSFDKTESLFAVTANQYTLLTNFNAYLTVSSLKPEAAYFVKEFIVNVQQTEALNVTFFPTPHMQTSYAFINGIEVVSTPAHVYMSSFSICDDETGREYKFDLSQTALEAVYRINVGGGTVVGKDDSGMFREWVQDDNFLAGSDGDSVSVSNNTIPLSYSDLTNYSAPAIVYQTARAAKGWMAWKFEVDSRYDVDSGLTFDYLLRLHFCEFMPNLVHRSGQRVFTILINNVSVEMEVDIINWTGGTGIPIFKDYIHSTGYPDPGQSKQELLLTLRPEEDKVYGPILNGLEIFKLQSTAVVLWPDECKPYQSQEPGGSLVPVFKQSEEEKKVKLWVVPVAGVVGGVLLLIMLLTLIILPRRRSGNSAVVGSIQSWSTETSMSSLPLPVSSPDVCRRFLLEEMKAATSNFDSTLVIGKGGFGNVYRGSINDNLTPTAVAIKRSDPCSSQGAHEFRTEIELLSSLKHLHLVSLIGYCDDDNEMALVYDYMPNGTLRDHLYRTDNPPLTWKQRLEICIGAARGLNYLHSEANPIIIHRDVKSNNILLDENWVAKISDFGLSKMGAPNKPFTHFSTNVKGTFGYLDPEYFSTKKLTRKSDVYAFGVVLFEVLSGRAAVDMQLDDEQHSLATWARYCLRNGQVDKLIDSNLEGQISPPSLRLFVGVAGRCLDTYPPERPGMADIVVSLEMALALQQNPSSAQQEDEEENINDSTKLLGKM